MSRQMYRYAVPVDDKAWAFSLTSDPVAVALSKRIPFYEVEFWAEHDDSVEGAGRSFQVFGTGHPLPEGARWIGTCPRDEHGLVFHLYEVTQ